MKTEVFQTIGVPKINKTLRVLTKWRTESCEFEGIWHRYDQLSHETKIPVKKLKSLMKFFRELNVVDFTTTVDSDYMMCGSGYFLNSKYIGLNWKQIKEKRIKDRN